MKKEEPIKFECLLKKDHQMEYQKTNKLIECKQCNFRFCLNCNGLIDNANHKSSCTKKRQAPVPDYIENSTFLLKCLKDNCNFLNYKKEKSKIECLECKFEYCSECLIPYTLVNSHGKIMHRCLYKDPTSKKEKQNDKCYFCTLLKGNCFNKTYSKDLPIPIPELFNLNNN